LSAGDLGVRGLDVVAVASAAGVHDLPLLVREADPAWRSVYYDFLSGAFGRDEEVWRSVSPVMMLEKGKQSGSLKGMKLAVVAQSRGDSLVGWGQVEGMRCVLKEQWMGMVDVLEIEGEHDECWESGLELARVIEHVVGKVNEGDEE